MEESILAWGETFKYKVKYISPNGYLLFSSAELDCRAMKRPVKRKAAKDALTIRETADRFGASVDTVKQWVRKSLFPNSYLEDTPRGPVRMVPLSDIEAFKRPAMGRPPSEPTKKKPHSRRTLRTKSGRSDHKV
jgi:hypothetical protein